MKKSLVDDNIINVSLGKRNKLFSLSIAAIYFISSTMVYAVEDEKKSINPTMPASSNDSYEDVSFDPVFLGSNSDINLTSYTKGNPTVAGVYRLDVLLNEAPIGRYDIRFSSSDKKGAAVPCLSDDVLRSMTIIIKKKSESTNSKDMSIGNTCTSIEKSLLGASYHYDQGEQILSLSIPQIYLQQNARGWLPPEQWESGINAGMLDYNFNTFSSNSSGFTSSSVYMGLNSGLNIADWRLRHVANLDWASQKKLFHYQSLSTYVEHDVTPLLAQVRFGDTTTQGSLFQAFNFRGVTLYSDDRMLPDSLSGYAPTIRATANSNAKVSVTQNGQVLYQTTVAPGPFEINDLYPTSYAGDLVVNIQESDGTTRVITVPYSSSPNKKYCGARND